MAKPDPLWHEERSRHLENASPAIQFDLDAYNHIHMVFGSDFSGIAANLALSRKEDEGVRPDGCWEMSEGSHSTVVKMVGMRESSADWALLVPSKSPSERISILDKIRRFPFFAFLSHPRTATKTTLTTTPSLSFWELFLSRFPAPHPIYYMLNPLSLVNLLLSHRRRGGDTPRIPTSSSPFSADFCAACFLRSRRDDSSEDAERLNIDEARLFSGDCETCRGVVTDFDKKGQRPVRFWHRKRIADDEGEFVWSEPDP
ncbi:hypothetical protein JAAARDRAFT_200408 [Jaapia argillacea MUCL 33604]|uniref:Uncharacterized protein n=1 Tax=Jaapia argillacea MUCL 33604 TaxID=933084 RepID=A0A067P515_9AGAM|nr:hypothetical protein JAAARDRAFT_200408 [Jaapia argillacea MUCL 33604]